MAALLGLESGKNEERKELARGSDLFVVRLGGRALEPLDSIWKRNSRCVPCLYLSCVVRAVCRVVLYSPWLMWRICVQQLADRARCV